MNISNRRRNIKESMNFCCLSSDSQKGLNGGIFSSVTNCTCLSINTLQILLVFVQASTEIKQYGKGNVAVVACCIFIVSKSLKF